MLKSWLGDSWAASSEGQAIPRERECLLAEKLCNERVLAREALRTWQEKHQETEQLVCELRRRLLEVEEENNNLRKNVTTSYSVGTLQSLHPCSVEQQLGRQGSIDKGLRSFENKVENLPLPIHNKQLLKKPVQGKENRIDCYRDADQDKAVAALELENTSLRKQLQATTEQHQSLKSKCRQHISSYQERFRIMSTETEVLRSTFLEFCSWVTTESTSPDWNPVDAVTAVKNRWMKLMNDNDLLERQLQICEVQLMQFEDVQRNESGDEALFALGLLQDKYDTLKCKFIDKTNSYRSRLQLLEKEMDHKESSIADLYKENASKDAKLQSYKNEFQTVKRKLTSIHDNHEKAVSQLRQELQQQIEFTKRLQSARLEDKHRLNQMKGMLQKLKGNTQISDAQKVNDIEANSNLTAHSGRDLDSQQCLKDIHALLMVELQQINDESSLLQHDLTVSAAAQNDGSEPIVAVENIHQRLSFLTEAFISKEEECRLMSNELSRMRHQSVIESRLELKSVLDILDHIKQSYLGIFVADCVDEIDLHGRVIANHLRLTDDETMHVLTTLDHVAPVIIAHSTYDRSVDAMDASLQ